MVRIAERRMSVKRRRGTSTREHQLLGLVVHGAQRGKLCVGDGMVTRGMGMQSRAGRKTKVKEDRSMMGATRLVFGTACARGATKRSEVVRGDVAHDEEGDEHFWREGQRGHRRAVQVHVPAAR